MRPKTIKKKTILVIEDERPLLEAVTAKLEQNGFSVITARSVNGVFNANLNKNIAKNISTETIEHVLRYFETLEHIDAIWLDHNLMGIENGLQFVEKFRANGRRWKKIPIFVVSNNENSKTVQSYAALGIHKYYVKSNYRLEDIIKDIGISISEKSKLTHTATLKK